MNPGGPTETLWWLGQVWPGPSGDWEDFLRSYSLSGIYLLQEALGDPVRAQAVGLIAGAFIIALSTILLYFIFSPRPGYRRSKVRQQRSRSRAPQSGAEAMLPVEQPMAVALVLPPPASRQENHADLALPA